MIKAIIFDFDGTIADTLHLNIPIVNKLSKKYNYKQVKSSEVKWLRDKKPKEILKHLNVSLLKVPRLVIDVRRILNTKIAKAKPSADLRVVLLHLKRLGIKTGILTSNSKENAVKFLRKNHLDLFDFVHSGIGVFGKHVEIKRLIKKSNLEKYEAIYVGDEVRDVEACKKAGVKVIAVCWGYNSKKALKKEKPDFIIDKPEEILRILKLK